MSVSKTYKVEIAISIKALGRKYNSVRKLNQGKIGTKKGISVIGFIVENLYLYEVVAESRNSNTTHQEKKSYVPKKAFLLLVLKSQTYIGIDS